jgi:sigma-E factor negative regulatory protein RseB
MRDLWSSLRIWRVVVPLAALLLAGVARAGGPVDPATGWIVRMNRALATSNYEGVLVQQVGQHRDVFRIVHRVQNDHMNERVAVVSPGGPGREFVRNGSEWIAYYPEHRVALVETRNRSYGFLIALNGLNEDSSRYYAISDGGTVPLDGWTARRISLEPRDDLRYGYRFWLDTKTALPLKTQLVARSGEVIEEIAFLSLTLPETIADAHLKPEFDATHFHWMRRDTPIYTPGLQGAPAPRGELMPDGFRVRIFNSREEEANAPGPRTRFIVSDGISWVSVFVEKADQPGAPGDARKPGSAQDTPRAMPGTRPDGVVVMGSLATYVARPQGFKVTVVGEVPPPTARVIAEAFRSE